MSVLTVFVLLLLDRGCLPRQNYPDWEIHNVYTRDIDVYYLTTMDQYTSYDKLKRMLRLDYLNHDKKPTMIAR